MTDQEALAPRSARARIQANLEALRVYRQVTDEGRAATEAEQQILAKWGSWGATGVAQVFDPTKSEHDETRAILREELGEENFSAARRTILNAHYTDPAIAREMWTAVRQLGFTDGLALEPGCGAGTFIGLAPDTVRMTGVELDPTTAGIAQLLYPDADIRAESFADTRFPEDYFDVALGNVPFGALTLHDPAFNPRNHSIHNHFLVKSLRMTRPGGLVIALTSSFTLDSTGNDHRRELAHYGDLVGAVRLPQNAFARSAGTDVMTDIVILRRRQEGATPTATAWMDTVPVKAGPAEGSLNEYYQQHPENLLGELESVKDQYGVLQPQVVTNDLPAVPGALRTALERIVRQARANGLAYEPPTADQTHTRAAWVPVDDTVREGHIEYNADTKAFTIVVLGQREPLKVPRTQVQETIALLGVRDHARTLLEMEASTTADSPALEAQRNATKTSYEDYVETYGYINRVTWEKRTKKGIETTHAKKTPAVQRLITQDPFGGLVAALEQFDEDRGVGAPAQLLLERQVMPRQSITHVDTLEDALAVSIAERGTVNFDFMTSISDYSRSELIDGLEESGQIFEDAEHRGTYRTRADYLSGWLPGRIDAARELAPHEPKFADQVTALTAALPPRVGLEDIEVRLGAGWLSVAEHQDFVRTILNDRAATVTRTGGEWKVSVSPARRNSPVNTDGRYGSTRKRAHEILVDLLNQRPVRVTKTALNSDGDEIKVVDDEATAAANDHATHLQEHFATYLWSDPDRCEGTIDRYNRLLNSVALRDYTLEGASLTFPGKALTSFEPRPHQRAAVARMIHEPAVGLFHQVGAGKTAVMVMGAMELKRLGLVKKPCVVVPDHMLEQFHREWLQLYPAATVLAAGKDAVDAANRRAFAGQIAASDWDAVIMTRGAFEKLPLSAQAQKEYLEKLTAEAREELELMQSGEGSPDRQTQSTIKRLEKQIASEEQKLLTLTDVKTDAGITFEQTGIDYLIVDEMHAYKNLRTITSIEGARIDGSQRAQNMHMKIEWLRSQHGTRVITAATATPIANSLSEMHVMQRYMRPDLLEAAGVLRFNAWAATFAVTKMEVEASVEDATKFRLKQRFSDFQNRPELLQLWNAFADTKTAADLKLPTPRLSENAEGQRQEHMLVVPPGPRTREYFTEIIDRVELIRSGLVPLSEDNMLRITSHGRMAALDMRLIDPLEAPEGKIDAVSALVARIYHETKDYEYTTNGEPDAAKGALQLVFCDRGTPGLDKEFSVYETLRDQLVEQGVPRDKVRFIHDAEGNDHLKARLFHECRTGGVSVLVGSTEMMGVGTNVQKRAVHLVDVDVPWRPADMEQRHGRILRQGNQNPEVTITRVVTEGSFDGYMYQRLETKARSFHAILDPKSGARTVADISSSALSFAEARAAVAGNPLIFEQAQAKQRLDALERSLRGFDRTQSATRGRLDALQTALPRLTTTVKALRSLEERVRPTHGSEFSFTPDGRGTDLLQHEHRFGQPITVHKRTEMADILQSWFNSPEVQEAQLKRLDTYGSITRFGIVGRLGGTVLSMSVIPGAHDAEATAKFTAGPDGLDITVSMPISTLANGSLGAVARLENLVASIPTYRYAAEDKLTTATANIAEMEQSATATFTRLDDLTAAREHYDRVSKALDKGLTALPEVIEAPALFEVEDQNTGRDTGQDSATHVASREAMTMLIPSGERVRALRENRSPGPLRDAMDRVLQPDGAHPSQDYLER